MIEWEFVAPMILSIVLILTVGGVVLLRPLTKRLVELIEIMTRDKGEPRLREDIGHIGDLLETMNSRLHLLEERQDFTDALMNAQKVETLPATENDRKNQIKFTQLLH